MTRLLLLLLTMSMSAVGISAAFTNEDVPKIGVLLPTTNDPQDSSIVFLVFMACRMDERAAQGLNPAHW